MFSIYVTRISGYWGMVLASKLQLPPSSYACKCLAQIVSGVPLTIPGALLPYPMEILRRYDGLSQ